MKSYPFKKLVVALVTAAQVSTSFAGFYLVIPLPSYTAAKVGDITVDPSSLSFAGTELGASASQSITISNSGQIAQSSPSISVIENSAEYVVSNDCPATLNVGQSCSASVTYTPMQNTLPGQLRVAYEPVGERLVSLSGQALFDDLEGSKALDFGIVQPGETAVVSATLSNQGTQEATLTYGSLPSTVTRAGTCSDTLAANASCDLTFSFKAASDSDRTRLDHLFKIQAKNSSAEFQLTAQPLAAGSIAGAGAYDYGALVLGSAVAKTFTLTNAGDLVADLTPGALPADVTRTGSCANSLGAGQSCDVIFTWKPSAAGALNASTALGNAQFTLTGNAITEAVLTSSGSADFGTVLVGETSAKTVTLTNSGQQASSLVFGALPTYVTKSGTCSTTLAGGATCTVTLNWAPAVSGSLAVTYLITGTNNSLTLELSGSSMTAASLSGGGSQAYGTVMTGSSAAKTWTISNSGQSSASLTYGALPADVTKSGTCSTTLSGGSSCTVILAWTPTTAGALNATYTVGTQSLGMTGTAVAQAPAATLSPTSLDFGPVDVGQFGLMPITITNTGNMDLTLPANIGTATAPYAVTESLCSTTLAVGAKCMAIIAYSPTAAGEHNSSVTINTGAAGNKTVTVTGTGIAPASLSGGSSQAYGTVTVGSSAAKTWTITNSGQASASLTYGTLPGNVTKSGTCSTTLAGGASCTVTLTWTPTATTTLNTTYTVSSQNNAVTLGLSGTASAGSFSASMTVASQYSNFGEGWTHPWKDDTQLFGWSTGDAEFQVYKIGSSAAAFGSINATAVTQVGTLRHVMWYTSLWENYSADQATSYAISLRFATVPTQTTLKVTINGATYTVTRDGSTAIYGVLLSQAQFNSLPKSGAVTITVAP